MKITLDHNCIIDLANCNAVGALVRVVVECESHQCFVVNIGASEMRARGILPNRYDKFEELLSEAGIDHLPRLNPMLVFDVTFWDKCIWADEAMIQLSAKIQSVLFTNITPNSMPAGGLDSKAGKKLVNRLCDVQSMWCHIHNKNDVFLTRDSNFTKKAKLRKLLDFGAGRICSPGEL